MQCGMKYRVILDHIITTLYCNLECRIRISYTMQDHLNQPWLKTIVTKTNYFILRNCHTFHPTVFNTFKEIVYL